MYKVNIATGKTESLGVFGVNLPTGTQSVSPPRWSQDGHAYAYVYVQDLSQAYSVSGLK